MNYTTCGGVKAVELELSDGDENRASIIAGMFLAAQKEAEIGGMRT